MDRGKKAKTKRQTDFNKIIHIFNCVGLKKEWGIRAEIDSVFFGYVTF